MRCAGIFGRNADIVLGSETHGRVDCNQPVLAQHRRLLKPQQLLRWWPLHPATRQHAGDMHGCQGDRPAVACRSSSWGVLHIACNGWHGAGLHEDFDSMHVAAWAACAARGKASEA
jgi:hypothetical protein